MPLFIEHLESAGALRAGLSRQEAADTVWAVNSTEVYQLMTQTRGWSPQHYQEWLTGTHWLTMTSESLTRIFDRRPMCGSPMAPKTARRKPAAPATSATTIRGVTE